MRKIKRKGPKSNGSMEDVSKTLTQIQGHLKDIQRALFYYSHIIPDLQERTFILQDSIEMAFWSQTKMLMDGLYDPENIARQGVTEDFLQVVTDYQSQYLAVTSVANFLNHMGRPAEEASVEVESETTDS
jgi:uncharacterized protein YacL (UPF0231 family)